MPSFDTLRTPDYSPLVVHFTASRQMVGHRMIQDGHPLFSHLQATAQERLRSILAERTIYASPMPFLPTQCEAVCFTECIWDGLNFLADNYSSYGLVFSKRLIFDAGGGPTLYLRGDTLREFGETIPREVHPFIAP